MRVHASLTVATAALCLASSTTVSARSISLTVSFRSSTPTETTTASSDTPCQGIGNPFTALANKCLCKPCELCHFDISVGECRLIKPVAVSTSNGADEPAQQPELEAEKWFLTEDEMTASRGGAARNGLHLYTPNNTVTTFAATNEYFDSVYADLEATEPTDRVWITGWSFDDVPMQPQVDPAKVNDTNVVAVMQRLATKDVDLHVLAWANTLETKQVVAFEKLANAITPKPQQGGALFVFDDRLSDSTGSHHQKTVAIKRQQGIVAYVGGTDLTWDRWDTIAHNESALRKRTGIEKGTNLGWMDAHLKVDGPAASDVANNFLQRWNMKEQPPLKNVLDPFGSFENPSYSSLSDLNSGEPLVENIKGTHAVQIVRTYTCGYEHYDEFAPHGEQSIFQARLKAIKLAKNFIFIQDQYFIHVPQLMDALMEVLPTLQRLIIVSQPASNQTSKYGYRKFQWEMVTPLVEKFPNKVQVLRTKAERNIYIHSKLVIVDDVFLSIGSANWNRRGMTTDSEIAANVVDSELVDSPDGVKVNKLARDYRVRKFMELTGKSYDELNGMKLLASFDALAAAANDPTTVVAAFTPQVEKSFILYTDAVQSVADPLKLCTESR